jgi:hypothetical protein
MKISENIEIDDYGVICVLENSINIEEWIKPREANLECGPEILVPCM